MRSSFGTVSLSAAYVVLSFAMVIILARLLQIGGYGVYAYCIAWAGFLSVPAVLGFDRLIVRAVATYAAENRWPLVRGLLIRSTQIVGLASITLATGAAVMAVAVFHTPDSHTFAVAMILVPLTSLTLLRQASLQGFNRPVLSQLPELLIRPLAMTAVVAGLWLSARVVLAPGAAMSINVAVSALAFLVGVFFLRRSLPSPAKTAASEFRTTEWTSAAIPMMVTSGIWIANGYVGTIMLGLLVDAREAGIYSVASRGADLVATVLLAVNVPLAPRLARMYAAHDHDALQHLVLRVARLTLLCSLPLGVGLFFLRHVYLGLFGVGFNAGAAALAILIGGQLVNVAGGPSGLLLLMTGRERWAALGVAFGMGLNVVANIILDPVFGVTGAAIGGLASAVGWNLALALFASRRLSIHPTVLGRRLSLAVR